MTKLEQAARQMMDALEMQIHGAGSIIHSKLAWQAGHNALSEQAEQDLDTCPGCGGVADNGHDREFPPNPYYCTKCSEQVEPVAYTNKEQLAYLKDPRYQAAPMAMWSKPFDKRVNVSLYAAPQPVKQEPMMDYERINALREGEQNGAEDAYFFVRPENDTPTLRKMFCQGFERGFHKGLKYAAPVRTKDLTDQEIHAIEGYKETREMYDFAHAVISAYKEKQK